MVKIIVATIVAVVLLIALAGCGEGPNHGVVTDKSFEPYHCDTTLQYNVSLKMTMPFTTCYDDDWEVYIKNKKDEGWVSVTESTYDNAEVGEKIDLR